LTAFAPPKYRLAVVQGLMEEGGGGIGAGYRFGQHLCLLSALQAVCEEWTGLRKR